MSNELYLRDKKNPEDFATQEEWEEYEEFMLFCYGYIYIDGEWKDTGFLED